MSFHYDLDNISLMFIFREFYIWAVPQDSYTFHADEHSLKTTLN